MSFGKFSEFSRLTVDTTGNGRYIVRTGSKVQPDGRFSKGLKDDNRNRNRKQSQNMLPLQW